MSQAPATRPSMRTLLRRHAPDLLILPSVALVLSAAMTWANGGLGTVFWSRWPGSFLTCLLVLPVALATLGGMDALLAPLLHRRTPTVRKTVVSVAAALAIETVLASAVTLVQAPWDVHMLDAWWRAFSHSFPFGLAVGLLMGFYVKPLLQQRRAALG